MGLDPFDGGHNARWPYAFETVVGGEPITSDGTQVIPGFFFLSNGWKVKPIEGDHTLEVKGNLLTLDGTDAIVSTDGPFNVRVQNVISVNASTVRVEVPVFGPGDEAAVVTPLEDRIAALEERMEKYWTADESAGDTRYLRTAIDGEVLVDKVHRELPDGTHTLTES